MQQQSKVEWNMERAWEFFKKSMLSATKDVCVKANKTSMVK